MPDMTIVASDLQEGDVVHYNAQVSWRITALSRTGKSVNATFVFERCEFAPERVGRMADHRFKMTTELNVTRG
jgi:hypothetical protein